LSIKCPRNNILFWLNLILFFFNKKEETISLVTKNRSLIKSKYRKGSLNRGDNDNYLSISTPNHQLQHQNSQQSGQPPQQGSTSLNYSNSSASSTGGGSHYPLSNTSTSRKSLISNPMNFMHIQHMGPNDGKSLISSDSVQPSCNSNLSSLPPVATTTSDKLNSTTKSSLQHETSMSSSSGHYMNVSQLSQGSQSNRNSNTSMTSNSNNNNKKTTSTRSVIAKAEISAPTNFRHVVRGLDTTTTTTTSTNNNNMSAHAGVLDSHNSVPSNRNKISTKSLNSTSPVNQTTTTLPHLKLPSTSDNGNGKSSSLTSSSSSSSSIVHSPHSPTPGDTSNNNENLSQAISSTLKANSVLYNNKFLVDNN
jgi:trimeric autotransporter adhesin